MEIIYILINLFPLTCWVEYEIIYFVVSNILVPHVIVSMIVQVVPIMTIINSILKFVDQYTIEILIGCAIVFVLLFLFRSFKRSMLIAQGDARFVLENFDVRTEKIHKWITVFIVFLLLPLLAYVKYIYSVT